MSIRQHNFTIERRFRQSRRRRSRVRGPELKHRWFGVPEGWNDTNSALDFRVGGSEVSVGTRSARALHESAAGTTTSSTVSGRLRLRHPARRRLISVSLTTVEVGPDGDGTRLSSPSRRVSTTSRIR